MGFLLHVIVWKIYLPKYQTKVLLQILFGTLIVGLGILLTKLEIEVFGIKVPKNTIEYFHVFLFVTALSLSYMITYSALEADSPSLVMIMSIADAGEKGLDRATLQVNLDDDILIKPRVMDLILNKMAYTDGEKIYLTSKGVIFAQVFTSYRNLIGLEIKGG